MTLSEPVAREELHLRAIELRGYQRTDGLFDVEACLTDTKTYAFTSNDRGEILPGVPLHRMLARMTIDEDMVITRFEAATEFAPYLPCPLAAPNFARLAGLTVGRGFLRAANERVGGVRGCTHLRELLQQMATVAFQTLVAVRQARVALPNAAANASAPGMKPVLVNSCLAYAADSPVVARMWPEHFTGLRTASDAV